MVAAAFIGGTEKVDLDRRRRGLRRAGRDAAYAADGALAAALERFAPDVVVDLSDEPVLSSADRFRLAVDRARARRRRTAAPTSRFTPPRARCHDAHAGARHHRDRQARRQDGDLGRTSRGSSRRAGRDVVVLAMGRGGPGRARAHPRRRGRADHRRPARARARRASTPSSDNYEDAVMSRVTTVGCRRCGGGHGGRDVLQQRARGRARSPTRSARSCSSLEGSGAAIPPVARDATRARRRRRRRGEAYVRDYFGPYRLARADLVVIAARRGAHRDRRPTVEAIRERRSRELRPDLPVRRRRRSGPRPLEPVDGTARLLRDDGARPAVAADARRAPGGASTAARSSASSAHLSNRAALRADLAAAAGRFDVLLTELKAAAIDVVAAAGDEVGRADGAVRQRARRASTAPTWTRCMRRSGRARARARTAARRELASMSRARTDHHHHRQGSTALPFSQGAARAVVHGDRTAAEPRVRDRASRSRTSCASASETDASPSARLREIAARRAAASSAGDEYASALPASCASVSRARQARSSS